VTVPSLSAALAWIVPVQGAENVAPSAGAVMDTVGGVLLVACVVTMIEAVMNGCTLQW
jgi:hypothetical protein